MMKIGILTYHDEVNYGSLLQAYAMQSVLLDMGYDAVIIDRWFEAQQDRIFGILRRWSVRQVVKVLVKIVMLSGEWSHLIRQWKSRLFIRKFLRLTPYHFHDWKDCPQDMGLDLIIVGSDQVWHPDAQPEVYLLTYHKGVPGIAYAASFGTDVIPEEKRNLYARGFCNFKAIGCREQEGARLVESLGSKAHHVVDPTLLAHPLRYNALLPSRTLSRKYVACYFLAEDYEKLLPELGQWARRARVEVDLFVQDFSLPLFRSLKSVKRWLSFKAAQVKYPVRLRYAAGPAEFVRSISRADYVLTNSFHALMFSLIYRRNVRIVKPSAENRRHMAARMQEFSGTIIKGPLIMENLQQAFASYERHETVTYNEEELSRCRQDSLDWLKRAIESSVR